MEKRFFNVTNAFAVLLAMLILPNDVLSIDLDCITLLPPGNFLPQQGESPFQISVFPEKYYPNDGEQFNRVNVTNRPNANLATLYGIILQVRINEDTDTNNIVGYFLSTGQGATGKTCATQSSDKFNYGPNTIIHTNLEESIDLPLEVLWTSHTNWGPVIFIATFITENAEYWSHIKSPVVNVGETTTTACLGKHCADGTCVNHWESCPEDECPKNGAYRCLEGSCIEGSRVCDGQRDCAKGEDEECCDGFQCVADRKCIDSSRVCNNFTDCLTGDDEMHCRLSSTPPACSEFQFSCGEGHCIHITLACDGFIDCPNGTDETEAQCPSNTTSTQISADGIGGIVAGVVLLVAICVTINIIVRYRSKKLHNPSSSQPVLSSPPPPSRLHTSSLQPGVYPWTHTDAASQPYLAGIGAGHLNQGFEATSPGQSGLQNNAFPVAIHSNYSGLGASNLGFMEEQPPSYEQATSSGHKLKITVPEGLTPPRYSSVASATVGSEYLQEHLQNDENSAHEKSLREKKQHSPDVSTVDLNRTQNTTTSSHLETEL